MALSETEAKALIEVLVEEAVVFVHKQCAPKYMTKRQALDFLEDVISRLEDSAEAIREDLGRGEG